MKHHLLDFPAAFLTFVLAMGFFLSGAFSSAQVAGPPPSSAPQAALEQFLVTVRSMKFPPEDPLKQEELVKTADSFLDLESMTQTALGPSWDETAPNEREIFLSLMWDLIEEVAYPGGRQFLGDFKITFPEVRPLDNGFEVRSFVEQPTEVPPVEVLYHLYERSGQWKIYDIILDGVSMIEDLSYQFNKIIRESSFSGLLDRMRERLEEAQRENAAKTA